MSTFELASFLGDLKIAKLLKDVGNQTELVFPLLFDNSLVIKLYDSY